MNMCANIEFERIDYSGFANADQYMISMLPVLKTTREVALENIKQNQAFYKNRADKHSYAPLFQIGARILLYNPKVQVGLSRHFQIHWSGPYYITAQDQWKNFSLETAIQIEP